MATYRIFRSPLRIFCSALCAIGILLPIARAQNADQATPVVISATMPLYPKIAVAARVEGTVKIKVTTNGKSVVSLETLRGPAMLVQETKKEILTWKFDENKPSTFISTFDYSFSDPPSCSYTNSIVNAQLPLKVDIRIRRLQTCDPAVTVTSRRGGQNKKD